MKLSGIQILQKRLKSPLIFGYIFAAFLVPLFFGGCGEVDKDQNEKPNILFIISDDLNDNISGYGEKVKANTPNLDQLRNTGINFINAHANVALCNPSRASLWSGLYPHTTGFYGYNQHQQEWMGFPVLKDAISIFSHFRKNGYQVYGTGKVYHRLNESFSEIGQENYGITPSFGPNAYNGEHLVPHPSLKAPYGNDFAMRSFGPLSDVPYIPPDPEKKIPGYKGWWDKGKPFKYNDEKDRDLMVDEESAAWVIDFLQKDHENPFFLTVGFMRPHRPQIVPEKYFEMYPLDNIQLPPYLDNDLNDVPEILWKDIADTEKNKGYKDFKDLMKAYPDRQGWKLWLQSYLACVSFVDDQLGVVLDALENSKYKNNTIIIFTSDHGYHMGEKSYMFKLSVWDESTRIPLIINAPGFEIPGVEINHPVSLIDLYPTLVDLAGLPDNPNIENDGPELDGYSLRPFLENPDDPDWDGPNVALSVLYGSDSEEDRLEKNEPGKPERQHFTVRTYRYRYTLTNNGEEELYDYSFDPNEWLNQANNQDYQKVKLKMKNELLQLTGQ